MKCSCCQKRDVVDANRRLCQDCEKALSWQNFSQLAPKSINGGITLASKQWSGRVEPQG